MRLRIAAGAALAALVALAVAGCGLVTTQATLKHYDPSDGVSGTVGDVKVLNVLAIAGTTGKTRNTANLLFGAENSSDETVSMRVQYQDDDGAKKNLTVKLEPGLTKVGYGKSGQFLLTGFHPEPGAVAKIYFQYGGNEGAQLNVPVLDDSWSSYSDLGPTPTPKPTKTPTPTPTPSESATATANG